MKRKLIATVDCGSSSVRCLLFDIETGTHVAVQQVDWYPARNPRIPGAVDFDGKVNWRLVCDCVRSVLRGIDAEDVVAVTSSGFRHGIICLDGRGNEVFGCYNMDSRAENEVKRLVEEGLAPRIYELNGDWPNLQGLPRLMWLKANEPESYKAVRSVLLVSDWVAFRMSGAAATEPGDASSTNILDLRRRDWSDEIIDMCGLERSIFPEIVDAGTVVGTVTSDASEQTGLRRGTPVVVGVADTQAGLVGVGSTEAGSATIVGGSFWLDCLNVSTPFLDGQKRLRTSCHSEKGKWLVEGVGFYVGVALRWFRDVFGIAEKEIERTYGIDAYSLLERLARDVPAGSNGLQVLLSDIVNMKDWRHAAPTFMGWDVLDSKRSHKGVFYKALLENAAMQARGEYLNIAEIAGVYPGAVILSGGAAKSPLWARIIADIVQAKVQVPREKEGTALGAAIYAGVGIGAYRSAADATRGLVRFEQEYEPDKKNFGIYEKLFRQWRVLYRQGLKLVEEGLVTPMWQAAGTVTEGQRNSEFSAASRDEERSGNEEILDQ